MLKESSDFYSECSSESLKSKQEYLSGIESSNQLQTEFRLVTKKKENSPAKQISLG